MLSYTVTDIFSIEYRCNLEIWVRGNSRSLKMVPFESFGQTDRQTDGQSCYINVARQYVLFAFHSSDDVYGTYRPDHVINQRRCDTNQPGSNSSRLRSADTSDYAVPRTWTKFGERAFCVAVPSTWNSLPEFLRKTDCTQGF